MEENKIGFLTSGGGGNPTGIGDYVRTLDDAGIPAVVFCNDGDVGVSDALNRIESGSTVPHVLGFRVVRDRREYYSLPNYNLSPANAAPDHWNKIRPFFHPRVVEHKDKVWIFTTNEVDKNHSDWLGYFALEISKIANAEGFKVANFGFSTGEPEYDHWRTPGMQAYLRYCAENPNMAGVSLHEYSLNVNDIREGYPYLIGRFRFLHDACDYFNIPRPKILISEWGWTHENAPSPELALEHIDDIAGVYAKHPNILGASIWYLGNYLNIADKVQRLIAPVTELTLNTLYEGPEEDMTRGDPRTQYARTYWVLHESITEEQAKAIYALSLEQKRTVGWSFDDAGIGNLDIRHVVAWGVPSSEHNTYSAWYAEHYPGVSLEFREAPATGGGFRSSDLAY